MKKYILSILFTIACLSTAFTSDAATMVLYQGAPPSGASVSFDGNSQISVSGFTGTLRVDYIIHSPHQFWSVPYYAPVSFSTNYADEVILGFYISEYPYMQVAHYYIYY